MSRRALTMPALFAIGLSAVVGIGSSLVAGPAFAQGAIFDVITKMVEQQRELAERRRQDEAACRRLQLALRDLGYYGGSIDGDFGPQTAAALGAYRRSIGRQDSGLVTYEEIAEIESQASEPDTRTPQPEPPTIPAEPPSEVPASNFIRADTPPRVDSKLPNSAAWIIIASRSTPEEAKEVAEQYVHWFPSTTVIKSSNERIAISIGWLNKEHGRPFKDTLISKGLIPPDSFLSSGEKFEPPIWSVDGHRIKSRADLLAFSLLRTTPALEMPNTKPSGIGGFQARVTGLPGSDFLSLRSSSSSSSKELRRLPQGTVLKVLRSEHDWRQVKLLNGITGWVSAQYVAEESGSADAVDASAPDAISPEEQERRRRMLETAVTFLNDLVVYLKLHPETPDIASVAEEVAKLQQAIRDEDFSTTEATHESLKHRMEALPDFSDFLSKREEQRGIVAMQALGEAVSLAKKHQRFLRQQIAQEVTSPNTPLLSTLWKEYESALRSPDLPTLTDINDRLKKLISEKEELRQAYDGFMAGPPPGQTTEQPPPVFVKTNKNGFLWDGALTDWVLAFNASGKAPHVARNIRGDIVFEAQQADACVLHSAKIEAATVENMLSEYNVDTVRLHESQCPETELRSQDVLIANRGELLRQPASYLAPLWGLIEDDTFQELMTLTSEEFEKSAKPWADKVTEIENKIATGVEGYGLIKIDNGSAVICMTVPEQEAAHRALINDERKLLLRFFNATPEIRRTNVEAGFISAKRGDCGAIYARRSDLADAIPSFRRDKVPVSVLPVWFEPQVAADRDDSIRRENEIVARKEEDRRKELQLKRQQSLGDAKRKEARETELRAQHGAQARGLAEEITRAIKLLVDGEKALVDWEFPELANWYRSRIADGWEFVALDYEVTDYGTADWQGRTLEAVLTDVTIRMKNRLLGERRNVCFSLGLISDAEFKMYREPFLAECENASQPTGAWKKDQNFRSLWIAE